MDRLEFLVQGSAVDPYQVTFTKERDNMNAYCTCPAGENGIYCKHRFGILDGSTKNIVSDNIDQVPVIVEWLKGTDVEFTLNRVRELEGKALELKKMLSSAKKRLAEAMRR